MRKLISFMHVSLDGYVSGPNGELDWAKVDDEIFDYVGKHTSKGDTALYGRITFEMMEGYWPTAAEKPNASRHDIEHSKWYKKVHKVVLSNTMKTVASDNTTFISENIPARIHELKQQSGENILVFGSPTATRSLIKLDLIDGYWLFLNPKLLGKGVPLFSGIQQHTRLKLTDTHKFSNGVIALHYEVERD